MKAYGLSTLLNYVQQGGNGSRHNPGYKIRIVILQVPLRKKYSQPVELGINDVVKIYFLRPNFSISLRYPCKSCLIKYVSRRFLLPTTTRYPLRDPSKRCSLRRNGLLPARVRWHTSPLSRLAGRLTSTGLQAVQAVRQHHRQCRQHHPHGPDAYGWQHPHQTGSEVWYWGHP